MSTYENVQEVSAVTTVTDGTTPVVSRNRFCSYKNGGVRGEVVLAAANTFPAGVVSSKPTAGLDTSTYISPAFTIAVPNGGTALIELGEAVVDTSVGLKVGADGKAELANAAGDVVVGTPLTTGAVGEIISFQFTPQGAVA